MPYSSILVSKLFWTRPRTFGLDQQLFGSKGKFSYYVLIVLNKVAQQFQILLFIDNSIANISLYALSRLYLNLGRLSDLGINFLCTQTREFCLLLDANCKFWQVTFSVSVIFCLRFASACETFMPLYLKQLWSCFLIQYILDQ